MIFERGRQNCKMDGFRWCFEWTAQTKAVCLWAPRKWRHPSRPLIYIWIVNGVRYA